MDEICDHPDSWGVVMGKMKTGAERYWINVKRWLSEFCAIISCGKILHPTCLSCYINMESVGSGFLEHTCDQWVAYLHVSHVKEIGLWCPFSLAIFCLQNFCAVCVAANYIIVAYALDEFFMRNSMVQSNLAENQ